MIASATQRQQPKQWLMSSLRAALEETTFPLSLDSLISGAGGVRHVGQCIISRGALGKVGSKVVIRAKHLFYICDNLKQSALLGVDF